MESSTTSATHHFEFEINGNKYCFDTVKSAIEKHSLPPYQGFSVIPGPVAVPLTEGGEVLNFTICQVGGTEKKVFARLSPQEFLKKLATPHKAGYNESGEVYEEWSEWEKTGRTSIEFACFDINARDVPGSGYYKAESPS
mmetsp:Transcript_58785/g.110146  ORF Transcript_58785/g.110146 Transcript_58785/m.110146 type:complete len:140 (+) Transcript_58785:81-500(+)